MRYLIALLTGLFAIGPAPAIERSGTVVVMTEAEAKLCDSGGGKCLLVNEAGLEREIQRRVRQALIKCPSIL